MTTREAADLEAMIRRMFRALSRRAGDGDLEALVALYQLERDLMGELLKAAHDLNVSHGYSWTAVALRLGITRQAAWQRWGRM